MRPSCASTPGGRRSTGAERPRGPVRPQKEMGSAGLDASPSFRCRSAHHVGVRSRGARQRPPPGRDARERPVPAAAGHDLAGTGAGPPRMGVLRASSGRGCEDGAGVGRGPNKRRPDRRRGPGCARRAQPDRSHVRVADGQTRWRRRRPPRRVRRHRNPAGRAGHGSVDRRDSRRARANRERAAAPAVRQAFRSAGGAGRRPRPAKDDRPTDDREDPGGPFAEAAPPLDLEGDLDASHPGAAEARRLSPAARPLRRQDGASRSMASGSRVARPFLRRALLTHRRDVRVRQARRNAGPGRGEVRGQVPRSKTPSTRC